MSTDSSKHTDKTISQGLKIFGDAWNLSIVHLLADVSQRFNELQRNLGNVSPTTLTDRLKKLEKMGIIAQERQTIDRLSVLYTLTEKGKNMLPVLKAIEQFSRRFL